MFKSVLTATISYRLPLHWAAMLQLCTALGEKSNDGVEGLVDQNGYHIANGGFSFLPAFRCYGCGLMSARDLICRRLIGRDRALVKESIGYVGE